MTDSMQERGRGLEEVFFARENERLRQLLSTGENSKEITTSNSGITDDHVLDSLSALDVSPAVTAAMALVPLIGVAWADGRIQDEERIAVMGAIEDLGINRDSPAYQVVDNWLSRRPEIELHERWKTYVTALCSEMDVGAVAGLRDDVMSRSRRVAEATGGIMGIGKTSSVRGAF